MQNNDQFPYNHKKKKHCHKPRNYFQNYVGNKRHHYYSQKKKQNHNLVTTIMNHLN